MHGDWHGVPLRVFAKQRGAKCMAMIPKFFIRSPPYVHRLGDYRLAPLIDMDMPDHLFPAPPMIGQRL